MKAASVTYCIIGCLIVLIACVSQVNGKCLADSNNAPASAWNAARLSSYVSAARRTPSTSTDLSFMSFNLQSGFLTNCKNDVDAQAGLIKTVDYVGTQETVQGVDTRCNCNIPKKIADIAGMSTRFAMTLPYRTGQYGIGLGTSQEILDTKHLIMTYSGYEQRAVVAVKTQPAALRGKYLWFANTHVEYYSPSVRQQQLTEVINFLKANVLDVDKEAVIVISGDFNGGPWDTGYAMMKNAGYTNSWEKFTGKITDGNTIPADWPGSRFDHIWYRAPSSVAVTVKNCYVNDVRMSDHRPITAVLGFNPTSSSPTSPPPPPVSATQKPIATVAPTAKPAAPAPASGGTRVCVGPIFENVQVNISCPIQTMKVTSVEFASYGTPTGTCGNYKLGECIGGSSTAVVVDKCMGRPWCTFEVANYVFGDPCRKTGKHFYTQVTCK